MGPFYMPITSRGGGCLLHADFQRGAIGRLKMRELAGRNAGSGVVASVVLEVPRLTWPDNVERQIPALDWTSFQPKCQTVRVGFAVLHAPGLKAIPGAIPGTRYLFLAFLALAAGLLTLQYAAEGPLQLSERLLVAQWTVGPVVFA